MPWEEKASPSLRPESTREPASTRSSRGLPGRTALSSPHPGHRPSASEALGSVLSARWAERPNLCSYSVTRPTCQAGWSTRSEKILQGSQGFGRAVQIHRLLSVVGSRLRSMVHLLSGSSDHGFQPLAIQEVEQLERRAARMLF